MSPLTTLLLLPLITAVLVLLIPGSFRFIIRIVSIAGTALTAILAREELRPQVLHENAARLLGLGAQALGV